MARTLKNKTGLYVVRPERIGRLLVAQRMRVATKAKKVTTPVSTCKLGLPKLQPRNPSINSMVYFSSLDPQKHQNRLIACY